MDPREGSPTPPGPHGPPGQGLVNNEIMSHLDQLISSKLACLEDRMTSTQKSIADSQLSKMKEDILSNDNYVFKRKSCEDQFKFNVKLSSKLRDAEDAVKSGDAGLATGKISEGLDLISNRQKVIRLADSSELGWSVVKEYQSNPLASDSEDEKRMMRAEARASRKMKQRRFERSRRMQRFQPFPQGYQSTSATATSGQFQQGTNIPTVNSVRSGRGRRPGLCYGCGKSGHWKFECLSAETVTKPGDKISINFECQSSENETIYENALRAITPFEASNCLSVVFDNAKNSAGISNERITPVNRLRDRIDVWDQMQVDRYIRDIIMNGYKLPFKDLPPSYALNNNRSARDNPSFVDKEIAELLKLKCISQVVEKPSVVNPLTVAYGKSGKARLVLDCRHINPHLMKFKHKYEDTSVARNLFKDHEFLFTYDLQSAYHIISIFDIHRTYLGFSWRGLCYVFNVLCFGLSTAGFIFSKLMRCPVKYFRSQGHKVVMFLDDGMGGHAEREKAVLLSDHVHKTLINLGFLISEDKCDWEPKQSATWLGHFWEMVGNKIHIAEKRILRLENAIDSLLFQMQTEKVWIVPVRFLASVVGQIVSLQQVFEGLVCMRTRALYHCIDSRLGWESCVFVNEDAIEELKFWRENVKRLNIEGKMISETRNSEIALFSDASGKGYGGYLALCAGALVEGTEVYGSWSEIEISQSSTWRELASVERVLKSNESSLSHKSITVFSDNKNVSTILKKGSMKPNLQKLAINVHDFCKEKEINVNPVWISRESSHIMLADKFSRTFDNDDWEIEPSIFDQLSKIWGKYTIDRFASNLNNKCVRFNSRVWCVGCESVDSLKQPWSGEVNWWVPPPKLICQCINKIVTEKACGTLVVPVWQSAPYWPLICLKYENVFRSFVRVHKMLPQKNIILTGNGNNGVFAENPLKFKMVALKIEF